MFICLNLNLFCYCFANVNEAVRITLLKTPLERHDLTKLGFLRKFHMEFYKVFFKKKL